MSWLSNGSKTLVTCCSMVCITVLAVFKALTSEILAAIVSLNVAYGAVNVVQNRAANGAAPPAP